jgi:TetR/AcrR family transcriptional repressor of nem operon
MHHGNLTRERLLEAAAKLVHDKGFGATSLNDLLTAAGIKKGTLYHHFPGKDDLGLAVLQRAKAQFLATLDEVLTATTPAGSLQRFLEFVLQRHRIRRFVGGCLFGNTALEMSDADSRFADSVSHLFREWIGRLEAVILAGQQAGQFRADIPADRLAQMIVSTVEGGIMLSRLQKEEGPLKACLDGLKTFLWTTAP